MIVYLRFKIIFNYVKTTLLPVFHYDIATTSIRQSLKNKEKRDRLDTTSRIGSEMKDTQHNNFYFLAITLLLVCKGEFSSFAQSVNIGVPPIWNYSRKVYKAGTQNWDAAQDQSGQV